MNENQMEVSLFATVRSKQPQTIALAEFVTFVRGERWMRCSLEYRRLRALGNEHAAALIKNGMEAITPGGTFEGGHRATQLRTLSRALCLDLDHTNERTAEIVARLQQIPWVMFLFHSISGEGLKVMVRIDIDRVEEYAGLYAAAMREVERQVQFACDPACRDVCHLCYGSYDPQAYYNPDAVPFRLPTETVATVQDVATEKTAIALTEEEFLAAVRQQNKKMLYVKSNRNVYLYGLLCRLNRQGMPAQQAQQLTHRYFEVEKSELDSIVRSAYSHANEHGKASPKSTKEKKQEGVKQRKETISEIETFISAHYALRFNVVSSQLEFCTKKAAAPFSQPVDTPETPEVPAYSDGWMPMTDYDENSIYRALLLGGFQLAQNLLRSILKSTFVPRFDPFVAYFASLPPWDGTTDYIAQLAASVTTTRSEYWTRCFRKWFVAMVAGWLRPEVVNHTVLVLIGAQGIYKTSWSLRLMPPELERYRYSGVIDPRNKDGLFTLSQCGLINHEEIENLSRRELNEFKALITQPIINERAAYGHNKEYLTRRASFIGSGNNEDILTDITGNRRWICEKVLAIRSAEEYPFPYAGMYAQAKALLDSGFRYWFDKSEMMELNASNADFILRSVEEEQLAVWFRKPGDGERFELMSASQVMGRLMTWVHVPMSVVNVGRALKAAGYESMKLHGNTKCYKVVELKIEEVKEQGKNIPGAEAIAQKEETIASKAVGDGGGYILPF